MNLLATKVYSLLDTLDCLLEIDKSYCTSHVSCPGWTLSKNKLVI